MLQDPQGQVAIEVFRGVIAWCKGTLLQPEKIQVSLLVTDDLGRIERDRTHYSVAIFFAIRTIWVVQIPSPRP